MIVNLLGRVGTPDLVSRCTAVLTLLRLRELWGGLDVYVGGLLAVRSCPCRSGTDLCRKKMTIH